MMLTSFCSTEEEDTGALSTVETEPEVHKSIFDKFL